MRHGVDRSDHSTLRRCSRCATKINICNGSSWYLSPDNRACFSALRLPPLCHYRFRCLSLALLFSPCFPSPSPRLYLYFSYCRRNSALVSMRRPISDGSNVIITCHLGLDIPGDEECLMWVGVDMERRAWKNNK